MENEEKHVSVSELMSFLYNCYIKNVWEDGFKSIYTNNPTCDKYYLCSGIEAYPVYSFKNKRKYLRIELRYPVVSGVFYTRQMELFKEDDKLYVYKSWCTPNEIKKILANNNLKKAYNYLMDNKYDESINFIYDFEGNYLEDTISLNNYGLDVRAFCLSYTLKDFKMHQRLFDGKSKTNIIVQNIILYDKNYLDHMMINFKDLPPYIQANWDTYVYKKRKQKKFIKKLEIVNK